MPRFSAWLIQSLIPLALRKNTAQKQICFCGINNSVSSVHFDTAWRIEDYKRQFPNRNEATAAISALHFIQRISCSLARQESTWENSSFSATSLWLRGLLCSWPGPAFLLTVRGCRGHRRHWPFLLGSHPLLPCFTCRGSLKCPFPFREDFLCILEFLNSLFLPFTFICKTAHRSILLHPAF